MLKPVVLCPLSAAKAASFVKTVSRERCTPCLLLTVLHPLLSDVHPVENDFEPSFDRIYRINADKE